jgi:hypothetical protein
MTDKFKKEFKSEVIDQLNPKVIIPIHFDDITSSLDKGLKNYSWFQKLILRVNTKKDLHYVYSAYKDRTFVQMKLWETYSIDQIIDQ